MLSVIVPIYNEDETVLLTLSRLLENLRSKDEILFVYDEDSDRTLPILRTAIAKNPNWCGQVRLLRNRVQKGPSGALRTGFEKARGSIFLVAMADLSDDLSQINEMRGLIGLGYDVICPSRYCPGGQQQLQTIKAKIPRYCGRLLNLLCALPTVDATNSFRMYRAEVVRSFVLQSTHSFSVTLELTAKAHAEGFRIKEIPTVWTDRIQGKSNFPLLSSVFSYLPWFFYMVLKVRLKKFGLWSPGGAWRG